MQKKSVIFPPLGLATMLAAGFIVVIIFVVSWVVMLTGSLDNPNREYRDESVALLADGTPIINCQNRGRSGYKTTHHTLDGKEFTFSKTESFKSPSFLPQKNQEINENSFYLTPQNRVIKLGRNNNQDTPDDWYFVRDGKLEGKAYFVGYDKETKQCLGYVGRRGKTAELPPEDDWFPFDGRNYESQRDNMAMITSPYDPASGYTSFGQMPYWQVILLSGDEILKVDLKEGTMATWMKLPQLLSCVYLNLPMSPIAPPLDALDQKYAVRTHDKVHLFDTQGKEFAKYAIPEKLRGESFSFAQIGPDRAFIEHQRVDQTDIARQDLYWITAAGKITRQEEVTFAQSLPSNRDKSKEDAMQSAMLSLLPPGLNAYFDTISAPQDLMEHDKELDYSHALQRSLRENYVTLLVSMAIAAPFAFFCYRRQRRYALPWTWVWVGFVFLFGVPGFLGYRFHRRWAVLDDCPRCAKNVPRDREACANCGASFPLPERKGIEVFA